MLEKFLEVINIIFKVISIVVCLAVLVYLFSLISYHIQNKSSYEKRLTDTFKNKILYFLGFSRDDVSRRKSILYLILCIFALISSWTTISPYLFIEKNIKVRDVFLPFTSIFSILAVLNIAFALILEKFIEKLYPLKDKIDPNTGERNIVVRAKTFHEFLKNTRELNVIAERIGNSFGSTFKDSDTIQMDTLIERWKSTDVQVAYFFDDIKYEHDNTMIITLVNPFWTELTLSDKQERFLYCNFIKNYINGILKNFPSLVGTNFSIELLCREGSLPPSCSRCRIVIRTD